MKLQQLTLNDSLVWANLLSICFQQPEQHMESLLCWLYTLGGIVAYGIWEEDKLIAQYACLTRKVMDGGKIYHVGMSMNMAVHPDYRGQGLIKRVSHPVYETLCQQGVDFGMGFSNADGVKVDQRSKGYGYQVIGQMNPHIALTKSEKISPVYLTGKFPLERPLQHQIPLKTHFAKDWIYFQNRYAQHPFRDYHYGVWEENREIQGFVVYRPVSLWGISTVALLDIYGDHQAELLKHWSHTLRANNFLLIHTLTSPSADLIQSLKSSHLMMKTPFTRNPYYLTVKPLVTRDSATLDFASWDLIGGDVL